MKSSARFWSVTTCGLGCLFSGVVFADLGEMVEKLQSSLVSITALDGGEPFATGSGFVINEKGIVATNYHVIEGSDGLILKISNGETYNNVTVVAADQRRDLALLKIPAIGLNALNFAPVDSASIGDSIYAFGNPLGLEGTLSSGIVSAKRLWDGVQILQISAPISSGSSGGPVVNTSGEVIGVSTAVMTDGQNLNFAMPAKHVQAMLETSAQPVPIAEFAAQNWPGATQGSTSSYEGISGWVVEQAADMGFDLELILSDIQELTFPEQEVIFLMAVQVEEAARNGFSWMDVVNVGTVSAEGLLDLVAQLDAGQYAAFAVCDSDCTDIDLAVFDESGKLLGSDEEDDSFPIVEFSLSAPQSILASMKEYSCDVAPCHHLVAVLARDESVQQTARKKYYGPQGGNGGGRR